MNKLPKARTAFLESLRIYGAGGIETQLLAGLALGDPILLVGQAGSAKTLLVSRIARELGLRYWAYDASKLMFEDILGFPNPAELSQGRVSYVQTPLSIFDKECVLFDELSRATASVQSKLLDIIRARSIMGLELPSLRLVLAAMNPPGSGYAGAHPLDRALAGRFSFILPMPTLGDMAPGELARIVTHRADEDARLVGPGKAQAPGAAGLGEFLEVVRGRLRMIIAQPPDGLLNYVLNVVASFMASKVDIDGRRAGMIYRNLAATLAVLEARGESPAPADIEHVFWPALQYSLPFPATGESVSEAVIASAHDAGMQAFSDPESRAQVDASLVIATCRDLARAACLYRGLAPRLSTQDQDAFLTRILAVVQDPGSDRSTAARAAWALARIVGDYESGRIQAPGDLMARAMGGFRELWNLQALDAAGQKSVAQRLEEFPKETEAVYLAASRLLKPNPSGTNPKGGSAPLKAKPGGGPSLFDQELAALRREFRRVRKAVAQEEAA